MIKARIILFITVVCALTAFSASFQLPGEKTRSGSLEIQSQETRDALQDLRIETLQQMAVQTALIATEAKEKLTWMFGAVMGFGALLTFLQVYQIRKK